MSPASMTPLSLTRNQPIRRMPNSLACCLIWLAKRSTAGCSRIPPKATSLRSVRPCRPSSRRRAITLPTGRGVVIAVAGPRAEALRWAETIRERAGLHAEDIVEPTTLLQAAEIRLSGESAIVLIDSTEDVDHLMAKPSPGA